MTSGLRTVALWLAAVGAIGVDRAAAQPPSAGSGVQAQRSDTADTATQGLLLDGVRAFRAERYEDALHIFHQVKRQHLLQDIGFYEGMALHKLGRHTEALIAFRTAHGQGLREPIADYYQAVSCYRLGMLARARREFSSLLPPDSAGPPAAPLGPRLTLGVQQFLRALDSGTPITERLQIALTSAASALPRSVGEALEWLDEAAELMARVGKDPTSQQRFHELVLRARSVAGHGSGVAMEAPGQAATTPTVRELNLLWCRVASSVDCTL